MKGQQESANVNVESLYRRYGPMVLRRCRAILRDEDWAMDAMQETFVRVLENRSSLTDSYPSALLYRMATNVCLNMLRSRRRRPAVSANLDILAGKDSPEEKVLDAYLLEQVLEGTAEGVRQAAFMHFRDGQTLRETARGLGLSVSGVRKRLDSLRRHGETVAAR